MPRVAPCLMFVGDQYGKAEEAMALYVSLFADSRVVDVQRFTPEEGQTGVKRARFVLAGRDAIAMDSGFPHEFGFTPAISLTVECEDEGELDAAFAALADRGTIRMPLQNYPFSPRFGWVDDRFGVSWQLNLVPAR